MLEKVREFPEKKMIVVICAAPSILARLGLLEGKEATCHPNFEEKIMGAILTGESSAVAGDIITSQGHGATFPFELIRAKVRKNGPAN